MTNPVKGNGVLTDKDGPLSLSQSPVPGKRCILSREKDSSIPNPGAGLGPAVLPPWLLERLCRAAREAGALEARVIDTATVVVAPWVRWKCRYGCPGYGRSLTCPPFTPRPEETEAVLRCYRTGILFLAEASWLVRYLAGHLEHLAFKAGSYRAFGLGAGPCGLCAECNLDGPCRRPGEARPSMEACGIDVFQTVRNNGLPLTPAREPGEPCPRVGLLLVD